MHSGKVSLVTGYKLSLWLWVTFDADAPVHSQCIIVLIILSLVQVQSVNTVEEIRITDLDMQNRWTTLERSTTLRQEQNEVCW